MSVSVEDWGIDEYNLKGSPIRKYFKRYMSQRGNYFLFLRAATVFDVFGINNTGELDTCGFQYPICQYLFSILWQEFLVVSDIALLY